MRADSVQWHCRGFDELDPALLYQIMQLRQQVFVVEQNCVYQDLDGLDQAPCFITSTASARAS